MAKFNFVCVLVIAAYFNVVLTEDDTADDYQEQNIKERPVGRSYSLTTCDYKTQIGYTCLTCSRALHCYAGNVAILVDCYGLFRYCRDGRCSRFQGEKCTDNKATTPASFNATIQTVTNVATSSEATTTTVSGVTETVAQTVAATVTELPAIDVKTTTKSDSTTVTLIDEKATTKTDNAITPVEETATTTSDVKTVTSVDVTTVTSVDEKATSKEDASTTIAEDINSNIV